MAVSQTVVIDPAQLERIVDQAITRYQREFDSRGNDVLGSVLSERMSQDQKWGEQNHDDLYWLAILTEEVGEVAQEIITPKQDGCFPEDRVVKELIQVAAVAVAWVEAIGRRRTSEPADFSRNP